MKFFLSFYFLLMVGAISCNCNKFIEFDKNIKDGIVYLIPKGIEQYNLHSKMYEIYPSFDDQLFSEFYVGDKFLFQIKYSDEKYISDLSYREIQIQLEMAELLYLDVTNFSHVYNRMKLYNSSSNTFAYNCFDHFNNKLVIIDCYISIEGKNGLKYTIIAKDGHIDELSKLMNSIVFKTILFNTEKSCLLSL